MSNKKDETKILSRIQNEANAKYFSKLFVDVPANPHLIEIYENMVNNKDNVRDEPWFDEAWDRLNTLKEAGILYQTKKEEDYKVAKKMMQYIEKRIKEEIEKGNLTSREELKKKYERNQKRAKAKAKRVGEESKGEGGGTNSEVKGESRA